MLVSPILGLVLKLFISSDRLGYKHALNHFLSFYTNTLWKNIKAFGPFSGNSKIAYPMD